MNKKVDKKDMAKVLELWASSERRVKKLDIMDSEAKEALYKRLKGGE